MNSITPALGSDDMHEKSTSLDIHCWPSKLAPLSVPTTCVMGVPRVADEACGAVPFTSPLENATNKS